MANCEPTFIRTAADGRKQWRCRRCGHHTYGETPPRRNCDRAAVLTAEETESLFGASDPTLVGNRIAALTKAIGIPPCGGCESRQAWLNKAHAWLRNGLSCRPSRKPLFVSLEELAADCRSLASQLPPDLAGIVGVARSGLAPASILAMLLHLPLYALHDDGIFRTGNGWRIHDRPETAGPLLVVDDTRMTGRSLKVAQRVVGQHLAGRAVLYAVVYCNPKGGPPAGLLHARMLPSPHFLEWNLFNSIHLPQLATDFDGILCHDCPAGHDDDGPKYARFLQQVRPLYLVRKSPLKLILTARCAKYRPQTEAWLARWGVRYERLEMWPGMPAERWQNHAAARWKAELFAASKLAYMVESDAGQAELIARQSGKLVICPAARKVF